MSEKANIYLIEFTETVLRSYLMEADSIEDCSDLVKNAYFHQIVEDEDTLKEVKGIYKVHDYGEQPVEPNRTITGIYDMRASHWTNLSKDSE